MQPDLASFDIILINSSAGKDSQAMLDEMFGLAMMAGVMDRLVVVHADLGDMEWQGTAELAETQAAHYSIRFVKTGRTDSLLDYTIRRDQTLRAQGKIQPAWPSNEARWCTSDFKRTPIRKVMTELVREMRRARLGHEPNRQRLEAGERPIRILNCMGLRAQESPKRAKLQPLTVSKASNGLREVVDFLPIHDWTEDQVWDRIHQSGVPYHPAYDLGMPRLSCVFCVFAPMSALIVAGKHNPDLLDRYIAVEQQTGHTFRDGFSLEEVKQAIAAGSTVDKVEAWVM